jgi:hypothetical protein
LVGEGDREMRDKFLVCSYVEGSGFLVVSELSAEGAVKTQEEIEREMAGDDSAEYLFVRDKAGELDFSIEANGLSVYREGEDGKLTLVSEGRNRIIGVIDEVIGSKLLYMVIDAYGKASGKELSFDEIARDNYIVTPFVGDSSKYRALLEKIAERKRVITENPNYFEGEARSRLTGKDCAVYSDECYGTEYFTVVRSFNHCASGVCTLSNRVNHAFIGLDKLNSAGIRVLDLSACSCLTRVSITKLSGAISESPITIIFNEKYHSKLTARINVEWSNTRFIGLSSVTVMDIVNSHIEGISALRVTLGSQVHGRVSIRDSTGVNSLKIELSEAKEARVEISRIDAQEIEIIGSGQGIEEDFNNTAFSVSNCRELTRLTVRGVGVCTLKGLTKSFFDLPKMVSFSLYAHMLQFIVRQDERMNVFSLTLGSTSLREFVLSAEYTTRGAKWLKVGYDKRVNLSIPTALKDFVVPMTLTDDCLDLLALTSSYSGLFMAGDKLMLDLEHVCNPDIYPILITSGGKVNFRVPSCVDKIIDSIGYWRSIDFRLILHSGTEVDKSVHEEVVRCD